MGCRWNIFCQPPLLSLEAHILREVAGSTSYLHRRYWAGTSMTSLESTVGCLLFTHPTQAFTKYVVNTKVSIGLLLIYVQY